MYVAWPFPTYYSEQQLTCGAFNKTKLHRNSRDIEEPPQVRRKLFMQAENWHLPPHKAAPYCLSAHTLLLNGATAT